jgi:hypothetical protein
MDTSFSRPLSTSWPGEDFFDQEDTRKSHRQRDQHPPANENFIDVLIIFPNRSLLQA